MPVHFPGRESLTMEESGPGYALDHARRHNRALANFGNSYVGRNTYQRQEHAVLSLLVGIEEFVKWFDAESLQSPFGVEEIVKPMLAAFSTVLDHDTGRLDCGTLDAWRQTVYDRCDVPEGERV
jgi:hypothetical protein